MVFLSNLIFFLAIYKLLVPLKLSQILRAEVTLPVGSFFFFPDTAQAGFPEAVTEQVRYQLRRTQYFLLPPPWFHFEQNQCCTTGKISAILYKSIWRW